jgi:hypothetical protein
MDDLLSSVPSDVLRWVEDALTNDESASDPDLKAHFVRCGPLTEAQASRALSYRQLYLTNLFREGDTPIRMGDEALRFNPVTAKFEPLKQ